MTLLPDGTIEMTYGQPVSLARRDRRRLARAHGRVHAGQPHGRRVATAGGGGAVGERFGSQRELDLVAVRARFYQDHPDNYDQLVIWTDTSLVTGNAFAFETTVANEIRGIGIDVYDDSAAFGSAGRLRSFVMMDTLSKYPDDPAPEVPRREQHRQRARAGGRATAGSRS